MLDCGRSKHSLGIIAILLAVAGCRGGRETEAREAITIANAMLPHASLVHVAAAKGFFASEGLDVTLQPFPFGRLALESLLDGKAELASCAETPVVFAALRGRKVSVLATISSSTRNTAVVARKDARIATPRDLAGKRIGVPRGTTGEFFLDTLLIRHGVDRAAVHLVELQPAEMADALAKGDVDAVSAWSPTLLALQRRFGDGIDSFYAEDIYFETFDVVSRPEFVRQRPAAAKKLLRALLRSEAFIRDHPDEASRTLAAALGGEHAEPRAMLHPFDFRVRLDQDLLVLMEEQARWAIRSGLVPDQPTPNFLEAIAAEPLLSVKPEAVGLIR